MAKPANKEIDFALRQLLMEGSVGTHEEICHALEAEGYTVNQPKISRLLHKIGAIKVTDHDGRNIYRLPHEHGLMHELNIGAQKQSALSWILDIACNANLIVIHTTPGAASMVAREIDLHHNSLGILGCIAGDDTIFIAPNAATSIETVMQRIKQKCM